MKSKTHYKKSVDLGTANVGDDEYMMDDDGGDEIMSSGERAISVDSESEDLSDDDADNESKIFLRLPIRENPTLK